MGLMEDIAKRPENSDATFSVVSDPTTSLPATAVPINWAAQRYGDVPAVPHGLYSLAFVGLHPSYLLHGKHMMIQYPPMYHHHAALYADSSMGSGVANPTADTEGRQSLDSDKGSNGLRRGSVGSSDLRDDDSKQKDVSETRKRKFADILAEVKVKQDAAIAESNATDLKIVKVKQDAAIAESNATDLKIGLNTWNSSDAISQSMNAALVERHEDEEELRRERRKQCNRDSARRSRVRKQKALEEMEIKVAQLNSHISVLNVEIERLRMKYSLLLEEKLGGNPGALPSPNNNLQKN